MDGNGRWAAQRSSPRTSGHRAAETSAIDVIEAARAAGVEWLSMYAFSTENWGRPSAEVDYLMRLVRRVVRKHAPLPHARGIRCRFLGVTRGDRSRVHRASLAADHQLLATGDESARPYSSQIPGLVVLRGAQDPLLAPGIAAAVDDLLDELPGRAVASGVLDFMDAFASRLPMTVICELMGVPEEDRHWFRAPASALTPTLEIAPTPEVILAADAAAAELVEYFSDLAVRRRAEPRDDLVSVLATAAAEKEGAASRR